MENVTRKIPLEVRNEYAHIFEALQKKEQELLSRELEKKELVKDIDFEIDALKDAINRLKNALIALFPQYIELPYDAKSTWKERIIWVLKNKGKVLDILGIIEVIKQNEDVSEIKSNVRLTIRRMIKNEELKKYESINLKTIHFALPEWFYKDGEIKEKYKK